ncbi:hypothetical protein FT663_02090 [Candidozyma haemuli var. vulneris]|uniref:High osmolarity signaling protein SHO1 n=1 Tax=Candidozyma haemuli TaxID=45357 RepID=A0A2V1APY6_9ASCO|nr:high osmolarity signaling protein SHO1 [[Candida] haemuloni]KAF3988675.1 hypothetical protein FT662_03279 [[Candida] haemuloni var. vulneris]KAF3992931.1 hypothetical protein FT663_02090 [[Candida] haemuloni var. vulneris]PVH20140.1 high osmolarity signaling protein SHO1 [[Candida] haemuloni]
MGFKISNFIGDPFAIATVSFGVIAWIVAIAGGAASAQHSFPRFTWWGLVYQIVLVIMIFVLYVYNTIELYKFTLVGFLSVAFLYTTNSTNNLIYNSNSSGNLCCAAGCILLSMLNILWILYFGGHPESPTNQFIDSFSVRNNGFHGSLPAGEYKEEEFAVPRSASNNYHNNDDRHSQNTNTKSAYMSSSQLNGLENFSNSNVHNSNPNVPGSVRNSTRNTVYNQSDANAFGMPAGVFRYKAQALYSYDANPEDINEISFVKDEILEVDDIDGKWWQARRSNGQVGICPSNYVKLLD